MQNKFNFHNDPGHGWVECPMWVLAKLGIQREISRCSFRDGQTAYLEEDCDAGRLVNALKAIGVTPEFVDCYHHQQSPCTHFPRYWV